MTRVVAVGAGWVTLHRHLPGIAATAGLELVGIVDRDVARGSAAATARHVPHAVSLGDPALGTFDAITIGTAPPSHGVLVTQALELGKHVLVEKPFAMGPDEARALVALARDRDRILAVVHNFQFARSVAAARRHVAAGTYGALRGVVGLQLSNDRRRLPTWYRELPGGLFYDESPHFFYLVRAFLGDARVTDASFVPSLDPNDRTPRSAHIDLASGDRFATLDMRFAAALSEWQLLVLCERATLACDIFRDILAIVPDDGLHRPGQIMRSSLRATVGHWAGVVASGARFASGRLDYGNREVFRRFARAIETGAAPEGISAEDGQAVVIAMHDALAHLRH
ncbi:MAG TPA: Gfo/Idh/MocA family oxidoreductase [Candidatus Limnocylindria bacterium]